MVMETLRMKELKKLNCEAMGKIIGGDDDNKPVPTQYVSTSTGWTVFDQEVIVDGKKKRIIIDMKPLP